MGRPIGVWANGKRDQVDAHQNQKQKEALGEMMRDHRRIDEILDLIKEIWMRDPDVRFNQLLYVLQSSYSKQHAGLGRVEEKDTYGTTRLGFDFFNLEDSLFLKHLHKVANEKKKS